jgi:hypothetical protein
VAKAGHAKLYVTVVKNVNDLQCKGSIVKFTKVK